MIDIQVLINKVALDTGYTVNLAKSREPNLQDFPILPIIFIGYAEITSKYPQSALEATLFNTHGEDLVQTFDIQIISDIEHFRTYWITIYKSLIGWNPIGSEQYHTGFTYKQGMVMGIDNARQWHLDRWAIGFATTQVEF